MADSPYDAQDRQAAIAARVRELEQRAEEQLRRDLVEVIKLPEGRRLLHALLERTGFHLQSYAPGDTHESAFRAGRRQFGIELELLIGQADPEALIRMQVEHLQAVRSARAQREAAEREASTKPRS